MFAREGIVLGLVILLLVVYYLGKSMNERRAKSWLVRALYRMTIDC